MIVPSGVPDWDTAVVNALRKTGSLPLDIEGKVPPKIEMSFKPK